MNQKLKFWFYMQKQSVYKSRDQLVLIYNLSYEQDEVLK